jgi:DNA-directed RNA polymerase subunit M/transcription elongation factor TFIIS
MNGRLDLEQPEYFTIDLMKIEGTGEFKCPKCGAEISPDDETEDVYSILQTIVNDERLEKIILQCTNCKSHIHLTGFRLLDEET